MRQCHRASRASLAARARLTAFGAIVAALMLTLAGGAFGSPSSGSGRQMMSQRRIRRIALQEAKLAGDPHPLLIEHASGTVAQAQRVTSGSDAVIPEGRMSAEPVYLVVIRGRFVLSRASPPRGARFPHGSVLTLTILARSGFIAGRSLSTKMPDLSGLGKVTVDLRARGGIPRVVRAQLLADARSAAAKHGERKPHEIEAVRSTERRARRLEEQARPGRQRVLGGHREVYLVAMKGRFTFICEGPASPRRRRAARCQRPHVLMLIVARHGGRVLAPAGWGDRYPDLRAAGVPVRLRRLRRSAAGRVRGPRHVQHGGSGPD